MSFGEFKDVLRAQLHPQKGSLVLFSRRTGNAFRCSNRDNRPGKFVKDD